MAPLIESGAMFYLASQSPRRRQLLEAVGLEFQVLTVDVHESVHDAEPPEQAVQRLALEKAAAGVYTLNRAARPFYPVLAGDTVVVVDDRVMGKPADRDHARAMLERLSGRSHRVLTAVALHDGRAPQQRINESFVTMTSVTRSQIDRYWASGEPRDKAGAYAIQGIGGGFVTRIEGSYSGIVGLPMYETRELLATVGIYWP